MANKIIRSYFIFNFLYSFFSACGHAIIVLLWQDIGLSMSEIALVNGLFFVACFVFEVPTGIVADLFGRRLSVIIGVIISAISYMVYGYSYSFWGCLFAELTLAFGISFISGALDAWLKDSLDFHNHKANLTKHFSNGEIFIRIASAISGFGGALFFISDYHLAYVVSSLGLMITALISLFIIREDYFTKQNKKIKEGFLQIIKVSWQYGWKNKIVWQIILSMGLMAFAFQPFNLHWSLVIKDKLGAEAVSYGWLGVKVFEFVGLLILSLLAEKKIAGKYFLQISGLLIFICIIPMSLFNNGWLILIFFWFHEVGRGIFNPTRKALIQENIPSDARATIGSFAEMIMRFFMAIGWFSAGFFSDYFSYKILWLATLPILLLAVLQSAKIK